MPLNIDCSSLQKIVHALHLVQECSVMRSGALRMQTPFHYPSGESIDVFLTSEFSLIWPMRLTDFGQTALFLKSGLVNIPGTERRKEIIGDITSQLGISHDEGGLYILLTDEESSDISDAIMRLSQACVRISDLVTHQRLRSSNSFRDDVEDFFDAHQFNYRTDVKIAGPFEKEVRFDFEINNRRRSSYVNVLAALNEPAAHASANEIFVRWHDFRKVDSVFGHQLVTVYNSASSAIREEDLARLRTYSQVISYPEEQDYLAQTLSGLEDLISEDAVPVGER